MTREEILEFVEEGVLNLSACDVDDDDLAHVRGMQLRGVDLSYTSVTNAALAHLKDMHALEYLNLMDTFVTDEGLVHLENMHGLQHLDVNYTKLSEDALTALQEKFPHLQIDTSWTP
jgi:hypothetical protein